MNKDMTPEDCRFLTDDEWLKIESEYGLDIFSVCKFKIHL